MPPSGGMGCHLSRDEMTLAKDAFAQAMRQAEKNLKRKASGVVETSKERGNAVAKLSDARTEKRRDEARQIVQQARRLGLDPETLAKIDIAAKAHARSSETWIFAMISTVQQAAVLDWLEAHSKRPLKAMKLWGHLLANIHQDTGEIIATRQDLADRVGMDARDLSKIMTELASINAIRREKTGRNVSYFLNPHIATHIPTAAARAKAREEAGPLLRVMEGGKSEE